MNTIITSPLSFAIAGSTQRTLTCAEALVAAGDFEPTWVLTPAAKPVGRKKKLTANPVENWAKSHDLPHVLIERKIDSEVKNHVLSLPEVDFLLVVDFGYLVPEWLLARPAVAPINVHPSALPRWRGSAPGQFALLFGETDTAVTIMVMNAGLDEGPILTQLPFQTLPSWTQTDYYQHGFALAAKALPSTLRALAAGQLQPQPQPTKSPTTIARQLAKKDAFVEWLLLEALISPDQSDPKPNPDQTSQLLQAAAMAAESWPIALERASRAFQPWPGLWTELPTAKGPRRMKILSIVLEPHFSLEKVHIAGQDPATWNQVKNIISE